MHNIKDQLILARIARWRPSALFSFQRRSIGEREILISLISFCDFDDVDVKEFETLSRRRAHRTRLAQTTQTHTHAKREDKRGIFATDA